MAWSNRLTPEFLVQFKEIKPVDEWPPTRDRVYNLNWFPPECPAGFVTVRSWPYHTLTVTPNQRNTTNSIQVMPTQIEDRSSFPSNIEHYDTTTLIYTTELNHFLEVPYDCTLEHVIERRASYPQDGWNRVTFAKPTDKSVASRHPNLWKIGHAIGLHQIDGSVYISDSWNNLLLPGSFYHGIQHKNTLPTCELAGKLTMLLGLVAFANEKQDLIDVVRRSFRPDGSTNYVPNWINEYAPHQGLRHKRGIVVNIAFDKDKHTRRQIEQWEWGYNGPILTSNESYNIQPPRPNTNLPTQPAQRWVNAVAH